MNKELLRDLMNIWGISGREWDVSDFIADKLYDYADEITRDALGNLIVLKKGYGENKKKIMCAAHMDEVGIAVFGITAKGYLRIRSIGGVGPKLLQNTRVQFKNGVQGIVTTSDNGFDSSTNLHHFYVDIGASDKEEALKKVNVGDMAVFVGEYLDLCNNAVTGKALDDRCGCYILMEALKKTETPYHDVYYVFTTQEEVGLVGAGTAAERIKPDLGIAVDITGEYDFPGASEGNMMMGKGAAIKVMDASVICDRDMVDAMCECAREHDIAYQMDVLPAGGTDAGPMKKAAYGAKAAGISIPTRYGHGQNSICNWDDLESCIELLRTFTVKDLDLENVKIYKK